MGYDLNRAIQLYNLIKKTAMKRSSQMKFRKKPVTIEAIQWAGNIGEVRDFMMPDYPLCPERGEKDKYSLIIHTLEGDHEAR